MSYFVSYKKKSHFDLDNQVCIVLSTPYYHTVSPICHIFAGKGLSPPLCCHLVTPN